MSVEEFLANTLAFVSLALLGLGLAPVLNGLADNLPRTNLEGQGPPGWRLFVPRCAWCGEPRAGVRAHALLAKMMGKPGCGHCGGPAPRRNEWVEVVLAVLLPLLWMQGRHAALPLLEGSVAVMLFVLVTVVDLEHRLVLMEVVLGGALLLLIASAIRGDLLGSLVGLAVGGVVFFVLFAFSVLFARLIGSDLAAGLGLGDVSLAALVGLAVGWPAVLPALLLAILFAGGAGGAILLWNLARHKPLSGITMAYGPYLAIAALVILVLGPKLLPRVMPVG
ncbi:MAG: A24 family peptidase [Anaerolineales bacterium]|jgi:prepilin signal peptidase PulO-like enzyme (type II secretory pathway)